MIAIDKNQVMDALRYVADYDFQAVAWLASKGPIVSSFIEDYCNLFDDTGLTDAMKVNQPVFGNAADWALQDLRNTMDKVNDRRPPQEVLDDPLMKTVRQKATIALQLIQQSQQ